MSDVYGKIPPHDSEAEKALLGILIMHPDMIEETSSKLYIDDFYEESHKCLYASLLDFKQKESGRTLDLVSFSTFLREEGKIEKCGGISYLAELTSSESSALSTNVGFYAKTVKNLARRRKAIAFAAKLSDSCYDVSNDVQNVIDGSEGELSSLSTEGSMVAGYHPFDQVIEAVIQDITDHSHGKQEGIPSGFLKLDDLTGGFRNQELTIIGARPSVGKTAFALSMVLNMILKQYRVGLFSLEMSATSLGGRLISMHSGVDFAHIRKATMTQDEMNRILTAVDAIYQQKLFIQDTPNMQLMELRAQARKMKLKEDVQIIFIDYIGLIEYENQSMERFNQVSQISRSLKQLARELNIPIICLCQVGRQAEGVEPKLSDLRDSGSIEQDADQVILLHREKKKNDEVSRDAVQEAKFILAKNRNGEIGSYDIGFKGNIVKFVNMENAKGFTPGESKNA
jgi:replicative DNA helicase